MSQFVVNEVEECQRNILPCPALLSRASEAIVDSLELFDADSYLDSSLARVSITEGAGRRTRKARSRNEKSSLLFFAGFC